MTTVDFSAEKFLALGLSAANVDFGNHNHRRNRNDFRSFFGCSAEACQKIWLELQLSTIPECYIDGRTSNPLHLLLGLRFLWKYDNERDLGSFFRIKDPKTIGKWAHAYARKLSLLLPNVMSTWEKAASFNLIFLFTIDGTHCPIEEPSPWSSAWSSFKFGGKAGVNYELGILIHSKKNPLLWINGPVPAGSGSDYDIFKEKLMPTMKKKVPGCKAIADSIYNKKDIRDVVSTSNDLDGKDVAKFKFRACSRHEKFNGLLKNFACLSKKFHHGVNNHETAFRAVCAAVSYDIEVGAIDLFEV